MEIHIPSLKLAYPLKIDPWKRRILIGKPSFLGAMLALGSVKHFILPRLHPGEVGFNLCHLVGILGLPPS